jgi:hypothetical protein
MAILKLPSGDIRIKHKKLRDSVSMKMYILTKDIYKYFPKK